MIAEAESEGDWKKTKFPSFLSFALSLRIIVFVMDSKLGHLGLGMLGAFKMETSYKKQKQKYKYKHKHTEKHKHKHKYKQTETATTHWWDQVQ